VLIECHCSTRLARYDCAAEQRIMQPPRSSISWPLYDNEVYCARLMPTAGWMRMLLRLLLQFAPHNTPPPRVDPVA